MITQILEDPRYLYSHQSLSPPLVLMCPSLIPMNQGLEKVSFHSNPKDFCLHPSIIEHKGTVLHTLLTPNNLLIELHLTLFTSKSYFQQTLEFTENYSQRKTESVLWRFFSLLRNLRLGYIK